MSCAKYSEMQLLMKNPGIDMVLDKTRTVTGADATVESRDSSSLEEWHGNCSVSF